MNTRNRTNEEWLELVNKQLDSGLTRKAWCEEKGVNLHTMSDRISRLRKEGFLSPVSSNGMNPIPKQANWVKAVPEHQAHSFPLEISVKVGVFTIFVPKHFEEAELIRVCQALVSLC